MSDIVLFIFAQEQAHIKEEITGKDLSITFDGTTRLDGAMAVLVRFVDSNWQNQQRQIQFQLVVRGMTGEQVARELITALSMQVQHQFQFFSSSNT